MTFSLADAGYTLYRMYGGELSRADYDAKQIAERERRQRQARRWAAWWHGGRV